MNAGPWTWRTYAACVGGGVFGGLVGPLLMRWLG